MRKEDFYGVYDYGDNLQPGATLKIERSITMDLNAPDLTPFIKTDIQELENMRKISVAAEQEIFDGLNVPLSKWERQAALTKLIDRAIEYLCPSRFRGQ